MRRAFYEHRRSDRKFGYISGRLQGGRDHGPARTPPEAGAVGDVGHGGLRGRRRRDLAGAARTTGDRRPRQGRRACASSAEPASRSRPAFAPRCSPTTWATCGTWRSAPTARSTPTPGTARPTSAARRPIRAASWSRCKTAPDARRQGRQDHLYFGMTPAEGSKGGTGRRALSTASSTSRGWPTRSCALPRCPRAPGRSAEPRQAGGGGVGPAAGRRPPDASLRDQRLGTDVRRHGHGHQQLPAEEPPAGRCPAASPCVEKEDPRAAPGSIPPTKLDPEILTGHERYITGLRNGMGLYRSTRQAVCSPPSTAATS